MFSVANHHRSHFSGHTTFVISFNCLSLVQVDCHYLEILFSTLFLRESLGASNPAPSRQYKGISAQVSLPLL